jgi:hypothetical protein
MAMSSAASVKMSNMYLGSSVNIIEDHAAAKVKDIKIRYDICILTVKRHSINQSRINLPWSKSAMYNTKSSHIVVMHMVG